MAGNTIHGYIVYKFQHKFYEHSFLLNFSLWLELKLSETY